MKHAAVRRDFDIRRDAAGQRSKVDNQTIRLQFCQLGCTEHGRRDGIEEQVKVTKLSGEAARVKRLHPGGINACKIAWRARGYGYLCVQCAQFVCQQCADAAVSDDQAACPLQCVCGLLHRKLYGTFAGREIVCVLNSRRAA